MVADMEVDKVADNKKKLADMELDMVADMKVDKVANKVVDMVDFMVAEEKRKEKSGRHRANEDPCGHSDPVQGHFKGLCRKNHFVNKYIVIF